MSTLVFVLVIAGGAVLCIPMIMRLWPVLMAYRSGALTGRRAAAIGTSRAVLALLGVITIAGLTSVRIMTDLSTAQITKSLTQADQSANGFQSQMQQQNQAQTADLKNQATKILATIQQHTPAGQSPRSVALSQLPGWLPELQQAVYILTPSASYATTGQISIDGLADPDVGPVCLTVPTQVVASSQYAAYVSGSACPS